MQKHRTNIKNLQDIIETSNADMAEKALLLREKAKTSWVKVLLGCNHFDCDVSCSLSSPQQGCSSKVGTLIAFNVVYLVRGSGVGKLQESLLCSDIPMHKVSLLQHKLQGLLQMMKESQKKRGATKPIYKVNFKKSKITFNAAQANFTKHMFEMASSKVI
ncbi:hypothetical protein G9A89_019623 [Geosiphon pyriformis]|nr:hypothetical protein G9A89_019623 [Geosiphon pyriformis]